MDKILFIWYPGCDTCRKARRWLQENKIEVIERHIVEQNPTEQELAEWIPKSGLPIRKFFNTSGLLYKSMALKDKLSGMSDNEITKLLASNGMLIKRPLLIGKEEVEIGCINLQNERNKLDFKTIFC